MAKNGNGHYPTAPGAETIVGAGSDDIISGSNGPDYIDGKAGSDLLIGRRGDDVLVGGTGPEADRFGFTVGDGHDVVRDYTPSAHDQLLFSYGTWANAPASPTNLSNGWSMTTTEGHTLTVTQNGANAVFSWENGDSVTLENVDVTKVSTADLHFSPTSTGWIFY
jgi:hypothetical protein